MYTTKHKWYALVETGVCTLQLIGTTTKVNYFRLPNSMATYA